MRLPWKKAETDLDREVRYHLDQLAADFEAQGFSAEEARRRARVAFGGPDQVKELCREESRWQWISHVRQDLDFGWRMLRKTPIVTAAAVLSLALGIGANTAIVSLMEAVLWRSLPVPDSEQLTLLLWQTTGRPVGLYQRSAGSTYGDGSLRIADHFSYSAFTKMREEAKKKGVGQVAGFLYADDVSSSYDGRTAVVRLRPVAGGFFDVLKIVPEAGRFIRESDDDPAATPIVVVTHRFFTSTLEAKPEAIGRTLNINSHPYTIAGVLPPSFGGLAVGDPTDLYVPFRHAPGVDATDFENQMSWWVQVLIRRNSGVTDAQLKPFLTDVFRSTWVVPQPKDPKTAPVLRLESGARGLGNLRRQFGNPLYILAAVVSLVLLIACANIANLLLARADARRKEVALRVSLGGSRGRLISQFLTESALLASLGGLLSLLFAWIAANSLVHMIPGDDLRMTIDPDYRLILATFALTGLTVLLFGLFPALRATRLDVAPALKEGAGSIGGVHRSWWAPGKVLVIVQVAIAIFLVAAGALFTRNLQRIVERDTGFDRTNLLVFDIKPGEIGYKEERLTNFYRNLEQRLAESPGVASVALARVRPMAQHGYWDDVIPPGEGRKPIGCAMNFVTPGFLKTLGLRLLAGRFFTEADGLASGNKVIVVSEELARQIGPNALGTKLRSGDIPGRPPEYFEVVGIVSNANYSELQERPLVAYYPNPLERPGLTVVMRTSAPPMAVLPAAREVIRELDRDLPIVSPLTMEQQIAETLRRERLFAYLCGGFGTLAVILSVIGLYGVISYQTARRRSEIGIRMALGASPAQVVSLVFRDGLFLTIAGLILGSPFIYYGSTFVKRQLFEMEPLDPSSLTTAAMILGGAALAAALVPALRASQDSPTVALRQE